MRCITAGNRTAALFIIVERGDDMERIESSELSIADIDEFSVQVLRKLAVFVFGVENKDLGVVCRKVCQQALSRIGFTGTGLTDDNHVAVDTLGVPAEKVNKHRHAFFTAELDAVRVRNVSKYPRIGRGDGIARNAASLAAHGIPGADLGADKGVDLVEVHAIESEFILLICTLHRALHIVHSRQHRGRRLDLIGCVTRKVYVISGNISIHFQKSFTIALQHGKEFSQSLDMLLQLHAFGVHAGTRPLSAQLLQRAVNASDRLGTIHRCAFDNHLCCRIRQH